MPPLGPRREAATPTTCARAQRPFFFDSGHFHDLLSLSRHATSTLPPTASALCVWRWFWGAAEPALPSGSFRTRAEVRAMASGAPPFRTTPPPTPPHVRMATPPPHIPSSAAAERPDSHDVRTPLPTQGLPEVVRDLPRRRSFPKLMTLRLCRGRRALALAATLPRTHLARSTARGPLISPRPSCSVAVAASARSVSGRRR